MQLDRFAVCALILTGCKGDKDDSQSTDDSGTPTVWECVLPADSVDPPFANQIGCQADFDFLAADPYDASIPGAHSAKTVIDRVDGNTLYFQNSELYPIHWEFCSAHLSGDGLPLVGDLGTFNITEYYSPDRRFILGAVTYYDEPGVWVYEISPYDTADVEMIKTAYYAIRDNAFFGADLLFHPTSETIEQLIDSLPEDVHIITTDELYAGIDYQPLNLGTTTGLLTFHAGADVDDEYTPFRELVVLDSVPNDISIVAGIITAEFQTPLAHINVLSANRGTPNMALRDAQTHPTIKALEGKWVELTVGAFEWEMHEITAEEAEQWWEENKPDPLEVQPMDTTEQGLTDLIDIMDLSTTELLDGISQNIPTYGAKATNYGVLEEAAAAGEFGDHNPIQPGFGVPMYYYDTFMEENGLWTIMEGMMADKNWSDPAYREAQLELFQDTLRDAPMRADHVKAITAKVLEKFPGESARFRSSTNSEDLGTFTGAGLYESETGDPTIVGDGDDSIEWAIKKVYSGIWDPRAYEEREYYSMNHLQVGMALLCHPNFPDEEANGVAVTNNIFDTSGLEPAFYVNAQEGGEDVVTPEPGVYADAYLHYYYYAGSPVVYMQHSTLVPEGETVLTNQEVYDLGAALDAVQRFYAPAYASDGWYGLEVDWKFDDKYNPGTPELYLKQARPYPAPDFGG